MRKKRSPRAATFWAGLILSAIVLATAGCASSKPQGASSFSEEWQQVQQLNERFRDGTALSDRGQEVSQSLDSHFGGERR